MIFAARPCENEAEHGAGSLIRLTDVCLSNGICREGRVAMCERGKFILFILVCCFILCCSGGIAAASQSLPDEARSCLECHGQKGLQVSFQNNESLEAYVNADT